jgi:hypothetical protein
MKICHKKLQRRKKCIILDNFKLQEEKTYLKQVKWQKMHEKIARKNKRHCKHLQNIAWKEDITKTSTKTIAWWNETHLDILKEVAKKLERKKDVSKD